MRAVFSAAAEHCLAGIARRLHTETGDVVSELEYDGYLLL